MSYKISWIEGPRWSGLHHALIEGAYENDLELEILHKSGLLIQKITYKITGDVENINLFQARLISTCQYYNEK